MKILNIANLSQLQSKIRNLIQINVYRAEAQHFLPNFNYCHLTLETSTLYFSDFFQFILYIILLVGDMTSPFNFQFALSPFQIPSLYMPFIRSQPSQFYYIQPPFISPNCLSVSSQFIQPPLVNMGYFISREGFMNFSAGLHERPQISQHNLPPNVNQDTDKKSDAVIQILENDEGPNVRKQTNSANPANGLLSQPSLYHQQKQQIRTNIFNNNKNKKSLCPKEQQQGENANKAEKIRHDKTKMIKRQKIRINKINNNILKEGPLTISKIQKVHGNKKISCSKYPSLLSKAYKKTLQITLLRNFTSQILTGPKFQAEVPPFIFKSSDLLDTKNKLRQKLLARLYVQNK